MFRFRDSLTKDHKIHQLSVKVQKLFTFSDTHISIQNPFKEKTPFEEHNNMCHVWPYLREKNTEKPLTDDGHEGVKVADVEAFSGHVNEELDDSSSVLLLHRLETKKALKNSIIVIY